MAFKIRYTLRAETDVDDLLAWLIRQYAGEPGLRWLNGLIKAVERLRVMPQRCAKYRKDRRLPNTVFQLFYGRRSHVFRILFRIDGDTVYILRIRRCQINRPMH
jgi:plasmid stabilization system protein ParE